MTTAVLREIFWSKFAFGAHLTRVVVTQRDPRQIIHIKMFKLAIVSALFVVSACLAAPAAQDEAAAASPPPSILEEALDVYASCSGESSVGVCLKLKALRYVDRAARSADIEIIDGFKIVQTEEAKNR